MLLANIEHLPKVITDIDGIKDILLAIDPEIELLRKDISDTIKELYANTADKYLSLWEQDFSLSFDSSLSLQERRQRILNKIARKKTLNWQNLGLLIKNNTTKPQYYIINDSANYHFRILLQDSDFAQLDKALRVAKPAYLTFDIIVTEYFKRTGTFNSGASPL